MPVVNGTRFRIVLALRAFGLSWHDEASGNGCGVSMTGLPEVVHGLTFGECDRMAILEIVGVNVRR